MNRLNRHRLFTGGVVLTVLAGLMLAVLTVVSFAQASGEGNLLRGHLTSSSGSVRDARMTDGVVPTEGDFWRTELTGQLRTSDAQMVFDLGTSKTVDSILLQGDANDDYVVSGSEDGVHYERLWVARPVRNAAGMRTRYVTGLGKSARYIKLSAYGGDGLYSIGEVAVYEHHVTSWPAGVTRARGTPLSKRAKSSFQMFVLFAIVFVLLHRKDGPQWLNASVLVPVVAGVIAAGRMWDIWPLQEDILPLIRAGLAAIGIAAVLRMSFPSKDNPVDKRWMTAVLAVVAVLSVGAFYHYGHPQFRDESKGRQTLVHPWDMRVYFPVVKYFDELHYDGLYWASLAAYLDNNPGVTERRIARVRVRDLRNNEMVDVKDVIDQVHAVRKRFSPERWKQFCRDMKYFQDVMGDNGYLSSLRDHGGNATPSWIMTAYVLWARAPANELVLSLSALLDPLLLLAMLYAIGRTFGWRVMLVVAIMFGTTDLSRFGTNLMGSTLRLDWMVALGFAACALQKKRWTLGGVLLAYAGMSRGFPGLAAIFLPAPALMWLWDYRRRHHELPSWTEFKARNRPLIKTMTAVVAAVVVLAALPALTFGPQASWGNWTHKIIIHAEKPNVNHVGLRNVLSYDAAKTGDKVFRPDLDEPWTDWQITQLETFHKNRPLFLGGMLLFTVAAIAAVRKRRLYQAALAGTMMIPIYFYPANYYMHYVFLLPLVAAVPGKFDKRMFGIVSILLLASSVALYWTLDVHQVDVLYTYQSVVILVLFAAILAVLVRDAWKKTVKRKKSQGKGKRKSAESPQQKSTEADGSEVSRGDEEQESEDGPSVTSEALLES